MSMARFVDTDQLAIMRGLCDYTNSVYFSLHTGPLPHHYVHANGDVTQVVSGTGYARAGNNVTWGGVEGATRSFVVVDEWLDDPYELDMTDATPTGVGDPLAGVLRSIDELLEGQ